MICNTSALARVLFENKTKNDLYAQNRMNQKNPCSYPKRIQALFLLLSRTFFILK